MGMAVAESVKDDTQDRLRFLDAVEHGLMLKKEHHRSFANQAYEIGVNTTLLTSNPAWEY